MTAEREKAINEWLGIYCPKCANNDDKCETHRHK